LHQVGTSSLLIYMMHGHTYIKEVKWVDDITAVQFRVILYSDY